MTVTSETLDVLKAAQQNPIVGDLQKAWTQSGTATSGITEYDLEAGAKLLYPVQTPLRNLIPRTNGKGGIQANWRGITGINTGSVGWGVSEGNRSAVMTSTTADYNAVYRRSGLEDSVTFEAELAAQGFDDLRALSVQGLLRATMIQEEKIILGGNNSVSLGTTPTPTLLDVTTGGTYAQTVTIKCYCVALTLQAYLAASVSGGLQLTGSRTLADGTSETVNGGHAQKSAISTVTTTTDGLSTHSIKASVTAVNGAVAYAWYWGLSGSELLGAITTNNSYLITDVATGTQNISAVVAADYSLNSMIYDGLLSLAFKTGSNAYIKTMATGTPGTGTPLTSDSAGGIVEIDDLLKSMWDNYRLSPSCIWVSSQEQKNISAKILAGSSSAAQRFVFNADQGAIGGGTMVRSYLNRYSMDGAKEIPIKLHPNLPAGTILVTTSELPYPLSNVSNVMQMRMRRDYYQMEWPLRTRKYEYGVYWDGVLQHYFTPSLGIITNIANG